MATEYWYPISDAEHNLPTGYDDYTNIGGANKNASTRPGGGRVGPPTHDDNASRFQQTHDGVTQNFQSTNPDWPGPIGTVSAFTGAFRRSAFTAPSTSYLYFSNPAGTVGSDVITESTLDGAYHSTAETDCMADAPLGATWSQAHFSDDQTTFPTIVCTGDNTAIEVITSIWGQITYEPPSGGFVFLLGLAGLMSLQMAGPMTDYTQFEKFLQWRHDYHPRHTVMLAEEKVQAWDEYKSYTHPRFFYG